MVDHKSLMKYPIGILVLVLIISVSLNVYEQFVALPRLQATLNDTRTEALQHWLETLGTIGNVLQGAKTNLDVWEARYAVDMARNTIYTATVGILYDPETGTYGFGSTDDPYYWISFSTASLDSTINGIYIGNQTGPVPSWNLDPYTLLKMQNITQTIGKIENSMKISTNGIDPVKQLQATGASASIVEYCKEISETYKALSNYYGGRR